MESTESRQDSKFRSVEEFEIQANAALDQRAKDRGHTRLKVLADLYPGIDIKKANILKKEAFLKACAELGLRFSEGELAKFYTAHGRGSGGALGLKSLKANLSLPPEPAIEQRLRERNLRFTEPPLQETFRQITEDANAERRKARRNASSAERRQRTAEPAPTAQIGHDNKNTAGKKSTSFLVSFANVNKIPSQALPQETAKDLVGDILFLGETNPVKNTPLKMMKIPGYQHFQNSSEGSGLGLALKNTVQISEVNTTQFEADGEIVNTITAKAEGMSFVGVYAPPNVTPELFEESLTGILGTNPDVILGDLNCSIKGYMSTSSCSKGKILADLMNQSGYVCLNRRSETTSTRGKTIKDYVWAKQSWPLKYFSVKDTDHKGLTVSINTQFHRRNRILKIKKLAADELKKLNASCIEAVKNTTSASDLYSEWLRILRRTYGSMPRGGSCIAGKPNEDLLDMGLVHTETNPIWKHIKSTSSQLPTNARMWTDFLSGLYNEGEIRGPVACTQNAAGACGLDERSIAGAIKKLARGKAPGPDGVRAENVTVEQAALLQELWKRIGREGTMPKYLNDTIIFPIHKKGDHNEPANFRPIALLNTAVKIYELAVLDNFKDELLKVIPKEQFGFKPKVCALDQVEVMMSQVSCMKRANGQAFLLFYDLQKAFDSVRREDLYHKMKSLGLPPELVQTIKLLNTAQAMKIGNLMMPWVPMTRGVRQGSPLSPLLFSIFLTLIDIRKINAEFGARVRLYADDIVVICQSAEKAKAIDEHLKNTFARNGLSINYGPGKSCYMQTSSTRSKFSERLGELQRVESYQYLGCLLSTDKRNGINYKGLTKAQSGSRCGKLRAIMKKFSWMLSNRKTSTATVNDLILALTRGNLYGVINPQTSLSFDYTTKGAAHIQKWESTLRCLIKDAYELPMWTRSDILHTITGIPHFRVLLLHETVSRIRRWRYLVGSSSPLERQEKKELSEYLSRSPLITKVANTLNVENPLLETTDWESVAKALRTFKSAYWRSIRDKTKGIDISQRGGAFLSKVGFQGWKMQCQMVVSAHCNKPQGAPNTARTKCPVCYEHHKDFGTCIKKAGYARKGKLNSRLASILQALKRRGRKDLIGKWKGQVVGDEEWESLPRLFNKRGPEA